MKESMKTQNPHQNAQKQLADVAKLLRPNYKDTARFDAAVARLSEPDRVIEGELEIDMDDGSTQSFKAFRSQHNNARGPYKGGIRYHHGVTREEVMALSTWMTWKCAVTGIPYGGGKGGIIVDPAKLSQSELQKLSRAYAAMVADYIGPWTDIPAPDVNTDGQIMAWMVDEWQTIMSEEAQLSENPLATFTGKPLKLGGSEGREEATGLGGVFILDKLAIEMGWSDASKVTVAIQGFGNVGYWFAHHAARKGYKVVAVSGSRGGIYNADGVNPAEQLKAKEETGKFLGGKAISNEELLELDVDVLVPAALENVITKENADKIKAKAIIEMANGPITPEADKILAKKKVTLVPDVLANAGGVTVSYFEWVQNLHGYSWPHEEVIAKLKPLMEKAFDQMWQAKTELKVDGRMATYSGAVKSVIDTMLLRGTV